MSIPKHAEITTGDMGAIPDDIQYTEVTDPDLRASVVAHVVRLGKRPPVGTCIGFSRQLKEGYEDEAVSPSGDIDITKTTSVGEKMWCRITVTEADIAAAHALINAQKITYREAGGKISQMIRENNQGGRVIRGLPD